ncbi:MAG TPA: NlpC/P60 family protein [Candidatus Paceibacterota bacterium]
MRRKFISAARGYIGTPFHHQGRLPGVGLDCAGVIVCAAMECGLVIDDVAGYAMVPSNGLLEQAVIKHCYAIERNDVVSGDILLFRFLREPQHLAIFDDGMLIHAYNSVGRVVENGFDDTWKKRLVGCYRLRGIE